MASDKIHCNCMTCLCFIDPRVENWFMMQSYVPTLCVVGIYLIIATTGPWIMSNRKPVNVQLPMLIYNLCLVLLSVYMFYEVSSIMLIHNNLLIYFVHILVYSWNDHCWLQLCLRQCGLLWSSKCTPGRLYSTDYCVAAVALSLP